MTLSLPFEGCSYPLHCFPLLIAPESALSSLSHKRKWQEGVWVVERTWEHRSDQLQRVVWNDAPGIVRGKEKVEC